MSKFVYACFRRSDDPRLAGRASPANLARLAAAIAPDNIESHPPRILTAPGEICVVINPQPSVRVEGTSMCLGALLDGDDAWSTRGAPPPEGCYAITRTDRDGVDILADSGATRSIWYYFDSDVLLASSSQRALVMLLGDFEPNLGAALWMLSSGTLGPGHGWDARLRLLGPDGQLSLDRHAWQLRTTAPSPTFSRAISDMRVAEDQLETTLFDVIGRLRITSEAWLVPLSGGYDSRGLVAALSKSHPVLHTLTWGVSSAPLDPLGDAHVASLVAKRYGTDHSFVTTDLAMGDLPTVLRRFILLSEGRIDHIGGYLDGCHIWKHIFERGFAGFIRGDEGFGWRPVRDLESARRSVELTAVTDFYNLSSLTSSLGSARAQALPAHLTALPDETPALYRDRLYHAFRIPTVLGALNEIKCAYVESCSPYLFRSMLLLARSFDDRLRNDKPVLKEVVRKLCPGVAIAQRIGTEIPRDLLRRPAVLGHVLDKVGRAGSLTPELYELTHAIVRRARWARVRGPLELATDVLANIIQRRVYSPRQMQRFNVDYGVALFRVYIAAAMIEILREDATLLGRG
jgi:hypothetical protein